MIQFSKLELIRENKTAVYFDDLVGNTHYAIEPIYGLFRTSISLYGIPNTPKCVLHFNFRNSDAKEYVVCIASLLESIYD